MLERLLTEQTNPESRLLDQFSTVRLLEVMNAADAQLRPAAVALEIPWIAAAADAIAAALSGADPYLYRSGHQRAPGGAGRR